MKNAEDNLSDSQTKVNEYRARWLDERNANETLRERYKDLELQFEQNKQDLVTTKSQLNELLQGKAFPLTEKTGLKLVALAEGCTPSTSDGSSSLRESSSSIRKFTTKKETTNDEVSSKLKGKNKIHYCMSDKWEY